jgi:hypothetical protein
LVAAKVWDSSYQPAPRRFKSPKIVLSTRFSLKAASQSQATEFAVLLKEDEYIRKGDFSVYSPNAVAKHTCDPEWTSSSWPCRGTFETCQKEDDALKSGKPQPESCWRYSFRYQLETARASQGCMIQLIERELPFSEPSLGKGQKIEAEMAYDVGTKTFRVYPPRDLFAGDGEDIPLEEAHIRVVASKLREWYDSGCIDMSDSVIAFNEDVD